MLDLQPLDNVEYNSWRTALYYLEDYPAYISTWDSTYSTYSPYPNVKYLLSALPPGFAKKWNL